MNYDTPTLEESRQYLDNQTVYEVWTVIIEDDGTLELGKKVKETYSSKNACMIIQQYASLDNQICTINIRYPR